MTFMEIDHEIISTVILLPSADSTRVGVSCKQKNVHKVLVNCLVELVLEKVWLGDMTKAVDWDVKHHIKQKHNTRIWFEIFVL